MQLAARYSERTQSAGGTSASERVYLDLRARIISFDLPPSSTLGRSEIAQTYGVSQTPVREALQRLEQDGLVLIVPQSKTEVSRIDVRQLTETQFLRVSVETEVVRRLATADNADVIRRARSILQMKRALVGPDADMELFTALDRDFHLTLFEGVGMGSLHRMLLHRLGHLYRCQRLELPREGKMMDIVQNHQNVLDGLVAGDPERASAAMRTHLSGTIQRIETLRAEYPDYFTDAALD